MSGPTYQRKQRAMTLIELIVSIVIIGAATLGVLSVMSFTTRHSADPMVQEQATLIAEAYLEEILLKPFLDPSPNTTQICPAAEVAGRINFDNICDYNGLTDVGARDQFNVPVTGLENYTVGVTVTGDATVQLGPAANQITNTATVVRVLRIDVRVQGPRATDFTLTGYRTNYNCNVGADPGPPPKAGDAACLSL